VTLVLIIALIVIVYVSIKSVHLITREEVRPNRSEPVLYGLAKSGWVLLIPVLLFIFNHLKPPAVIAGNASSPSADGSLLYSLAPLLVGYLSIVLFVSVIVFFYIAMDKYQATYGRWRIPERTLHRLEFFGGWPGSRLAQRLLWHKISKPRYQFVYWAAMAGHTAILLLAGYAYYIWPLPSLSRPSGTTPTVVSGLNVIPSTDVSAESAKRAAAESAKRTAEAAYRKVVKKVGAAGAESYSADLDEIRLQREQADKLLKSQNYKDSEEEYRKMKEKVVNLEKKLDRAAAIPRPTS